MRQTMSEGAIFDYLAELIGQPLWKCGRAEDMHWFALGERRQTRSPMGQILERAEFGLHVQCPWRIMRGERVLVGGADVVDPRPDSRRGPEKFRAERLGSISDVLLKKLNERVLPARVLSTALEPGHLLRLTFEFDLTLQVFPDGVTEVDHWRLFRQGVSAPHLLCRGGALNVERAVG